MLESSKDILYLVISFCVLWVTVFLCWMFYYVTKILRNASQIAEEFRMRLQSLTDATNYIKGKLEHISGLLALATGGVTGLAKRYATKKANEWINKGSEKMNDAAKEAVDKAVEATAKKMKNVSKKISAKGGPAYGGKK